MAAAADSEGCEVNLTPLLDLVLQLIMFFLITVNFVRVDQFADEIVLPLASSAIPLDNSAESFIFLNLDKDGRLIGTLAQFVLDTPEKLKAHLIREREKHEEEARERGVKGEVKVVVILRADQHCKYGDVWTALNSCQRAGFKQWHLRVMTSGARPEKT